MRDCTSNSLIQICFNARHMTYETGLTLGRLLHEHGIEPTKVTTSVNGGFVARSQRDSTYLQDGDQVLTFQAIVGG